MYNTGLKGQANYSNKLAISVFITLDKISNGILDNINQDNLFIVYLFLMFTR